MFSIHYRFLFSLASDLHWNCPVLTRQTEYDFHYKLHIKTVNAGDLKTGESPELVNKLLRRRNGSWRLNWSVANGIFRIGETCQNKTLRPKVINWLALPILTYIWILSPKNLCGLQGLAGKSSIEFLGPRELPLVCRLVILASFILAADSWFFIRLQH